MEKTARRATSGAYLLRMPVLIKETMIQLANLHHRHLSTEILMAMEYWIAANKKELHAAKE